MPCNIAGTDCAPVSPSLGSLTIFFGGSKKVPILTDANACLDPICWAPAPEILLMVQNSATDLNLMLARETGR